MIKNVKRFLVEAPGIKYLLAAIVLLEILDGLSTYFLIRGGLAREGNPFLESFVGDKKFLLLKILGGLLCAFLLWDIHRRWPKLAVISASFLVVALSGIVFWNIYAYYLASA